MSHFRVFKLRKMSQKKKQLRPVRRYSEELKKHIVK
ncbi:MAG: hypothetical protein ACI8ZN_002504, partial [Bacteroidia bacterium]